MKKLIAYDLDGTLANTREDIVRGVRYVLEKMSAPILEGDEIIGYVGSGLHELMARSLKTADEKVIEKGAKHYRSHYAQHMMDHTLLYPDALKVLDYFRGKVQAVITNKPNPFTVQMLKSLGVSGFFGYVVASNDGFPKKPDPASFLHILEKEGFSPADALFIGDSAVDIQTGRAAGVETVVLAHGFTTANELQSLSPDYMAAGFEELLSLARAHNW